MEIFKENLKENIKRLALQNLDKEPILIQEKKKLTELQDELNKSRNEYKTVREEYGKMF